MSEQVQATPEVPVVETPVPEVWTAEAIKAWPIEKLRGEMRKDRDRIQGILNGSIVEVAPEPVVETPVLETPVVAEVPSQPEVQATPVETPVAPAKKEKIVVKYQVKDEEGKPIGQPTYLQADTWEEMSEKQRICHENSVRQAARYKRQRLNAKFVEVAPPELAKELSEEELNKLKADLDNPDPLVQSKAVVAIKDHELKMEKKTLADERAKTRAEQASYSFIKDHVQDYNNCDANNALLKKFITDNELEWNRDNLELAFQSIEGQLAPVARREEVPVTPQPVVVNTPAPAPAPVVAATPVEAPAAAPVAPAVQQPPVVRPRPGVNGGVAPGSNRTPVQVAQPVGLTKADIAKMTGPELRKYIGKDPAKKAEIERIVNSR